MPAPTAPARTTPARRTSLRRTPALTAAALAAGTLAAVLVPAVAQAAPASSASTSTTGVVTHTNTLTRDVTRLQKGTGVAAEQKALASYWTADRMKAAVPYEKSAEFASRGLPSADSLKTTPAKVGTFGAVGPARTAKAPGVTAGTTPSYWQPGLPYYSPTARTNGKVFFSRSGYNYVCSASIVNSEGKSLIWTAGHCTADGGVWSTNFTFVPSYSNGSAPYGYWYASSLTTRSAWFSNRDFSQDNGAALVRRNSSGWRITDYLGGQGIMWNYSASFYANAFGYPQASPFNGATLYEAAGTTYSAGSTIYMYSGLTGGSSGGPWFRNFDGNWGYVNGHNDFIYTSSPAWMYSPYYGDQVASLYNAVRYTSG